MPFTIQSSIDLPQMNQWKRVLFLPAGSCFIFSGRKLLYQSSVGRTRCLGQDRNGISLYLRLRHFRRLQANRRRHLNLRQKNRDTQLIFVLKNEVIHQFLSFFSATNWWFLTQNGGKIDRQWWRLVFMPDFYSLIDRWWILIKHIVAWKDILISILHQF